MAAQPKDSSNHKQLPTEDSRVLQLTLDPEAKGIISHRPFFSLWQYTGWWHNLAWQWTPSKNCPLHTDCDSTGADSANTHSKRLYKQVDHQIHHFDSKRQHPAIPLLCVCISGPPTQNESACMRLPVCMCKLNLFRAAGLQMHACKHTPANFFSARHTGACVCHSTTPRHMFVCVCVHMYEYEQVYRVSSWATRPFFAK